MKIKVGVIYGGETVEHEVSIISAVQAMNQINSEKYEVVPIYISKTRQWYTGKMLLEMDVYKDFNMLKRYAKKVVLCKGKETFYLQSLGMFKSFVTDIDIVFPIVHGNGAEDGSIQGYLETLGIPYVGSGVLGSALGQDKVIMKQVFEAAKLPVVPYTWFFDIEYIVDNEDILNRVKKIGYPVIVKPATLGSSVGITYVNDANELDDAINDAISYDTKIVVEKVINNLIEVNCSVLGNYEYQDVSAIEEVLGSKNFLTYSDKYLGNSKTKGSSTKGMVNTQRIIPARISDNLSDKVRKLSKEVFNVLNLNGVCRIDFLIDSKENTVYINEPNTIPGSLAFYLWEPVGKSYETLLDDLITLAIKNYKNKNKKTRSFDSNILSNYNGTKGCKGKLKGN